MEKARKLRLTLWPGFDWWNGGPQVFIDKRGNARVNPGEAAKPNAASVAINKILHYFPHVQELSVDVLMQASEGGRWDLPDRKWENVQPWLDASIVPSVGPNMETIVRKLTGFWDVSRPEPFYIQHEVRQSEREWKIDRKGDMATVSSSASAPNKWCTCSLSMPAAHNEVLLRYRQRRRHGVSTLPGHRGILHPQRLNAT